MGKKTGRRAKRILALVFACTLLLGSMNVFAAENETETQETETQEKSGTLTLKSVSYQCRDEVGKRGESWGARLINTGKEDIDLSQYDLKARGTDASDGVEFELDPIQTPVLKGVDESGEGGMTFLSFSYMIPADCKEPVIKFVVDIFEKGDSTTPLYTTEENELYPYVITDGVLKHNDTTRPAEYQLKVETDTGIHFDPIMGPIYSDGEWTEIREEEGVRWFLKPGYPQSFEVTMDENYAPAVAELIPSDAGTVRRVQGQPGIFAVDLHAPATLKVSSAKINTKNWMNTVEQYVANMQWIDLKKQSTQESHFFEEAALADDVAVVTYCRGNYDAYRDEAGNVVIPYADFVKDAEKFFQNIPDLKAVNVENLISYDASKDAFVGTDAQYAEAPYTTVVEKVDEYANNTYAIRFKLSKKTLAEGVSDMDDSQQYTECTLVVEDNGQGQWRYLAYVKDWDFTPNVTEEPVEPQKPAEPEQDAPLVNPNKDEEFSTEFTNRVVDAIEKAENNSEVVVGMNGATEIPAEVLQAMKDKDVNLVLDMGDYTWTINGKDVTAEELKNVDLGVAFNTGAIPEEVVNTVAKNKGNIQISIAYDGELGFKATLRIYVGKEHNGKAAKLYYYNKNGKLELVQEATVVLDGTVSYTFEHASDYLVVIDETSSTSNKNEAPKTGDSVSVTFSVSLLAFAAVVLAALLRKKVYNRI